MVYQREIRNVVFVSLNCLKISLQESPKRNIWCLKKIIRKLTEYLFMILDLGTTLFWNGSLFTEV